jgi:hypothetical protein
MLYQFTISGGRMNKHIVWAIALVIAVVAAFLVGRNSTAQELQDAKTQVEKMTAEKAVRQTFAGAEKHEISAEEAKKLIEHYAKKAKKDDMQSGTYHRAIIDKILAQPGCTGLRLYFGSSEAKKMTIVAFGVDSAGKNLSGVIGDEIAPCPPWCMGDR